jgi:hypothetical protein
MRTGFLFVLLLFIIGSHINAQQGCTSYEYRQQELLLNPALNAKINEIEAFIQQRKASGISSTARENQPLITIPVVIHILYNNAEENVPDVFITSQLDLLNRAFRRQNADSNNTPLRFRSVAADCDIEFKLAISDPQRRPTSGVIRKYTPVKKWEADDKMKYASKGGDDAWDNNKYLNIWVCNLTRVLGYATFPGGEAAKDGVVLQYNIFKWQNTIIHETGHWLNLRHIWGDEYCGDDLVDDTPKQGSYSSGCPSGIRSTCDNGVNGDMYMNYMDVTSGECINLFTEGQKKRMRSLFVAGGARTSLLSSHALLPPTNYESPVPVPEEKPKVEISSIYPNPATTEITMDFSHDVRWVGRSIMITSLQGLPMIQVNVTSKVMKVNVEKLKTGIYFITGKNEDGTTIKQKLVKI